LGSEGCLCKEGGCGNPTSTMYNLPQLLLGLILSICYHILFFVFSCSMLLADLLRYATRLKHRIHQPASLSHLQNKVSSMKKTPQHIAIIVDFKEHRLRDNLDLYAIAQLICWCTGAGITYITLYDLNGVLKGSREVLSKHVSEYGQHFFGKKYLELNISLLRTDHDEGFSCGNENSPNGMPETCHSKTQTHFFVQLLSGIDGHPNIVQAVKKIAKKVHTHETGVSEISEPVLSAYLRSQAPSLPKYAPDEPDLVILFPFLANSIRTNYSFQHPPKTHTRKTTQRCEELGWVSSPPIVIDGFLPWHIRLSEFVQMPTCSLESFCHALESFMRTTKRHGV